SPAAPSAGATAAASATAASSTAAGPAVDGGTITVAIDSDLGGAFDIHSTAADISALVLRNVFDSLVVEDTDGTFKPWLANSWDISTDGLTYTFHLKSGVTFQDGEAFDASAVVANL